MENGALIRIKLDPDSGDRPLAEQKIRQIMMETGGVIWEPPEKI